MGLSYDVALVTGADLVTYTSQTGLGNLEDTAELDLDALALDCQREVYERLHGNGLTAEQLAALDNANWLRRQIAALALARIEEIHLGRADVAEARRMAAHRAIDAFRPQITSIDGAIPRQSGEGIPGVAHSSAGLVYGIPSSTPLETDYSRSNLPTDLG